MNNIIPQMIVVYTQPEEVLADLVDMVYVVDEYGNGRLTLTYSADLHNVTQEDLEAVVRIATEKITSYANAHDGYALSRSASVSLADQPAYPDDMEDLDFDDLQF